MALDVDAEVVIDRTREEVASYAMDPANDPVWIGGIKSARMITDPPLGIGTRVERVASFLGKRIEYVLEVVEYEPAERIAMRSVKGPFPMHVTYVFLPAPDGTAAQIRVQGESVGFYSIAGPLLSKAVRRNITNDLKGLKKILETGDSGAPSQPPPD